MIRWGPRITCPVCGRVGASYTPAQGDGTAWRPWPHDEIRIVRTTIAAGLRGVRSTARRCSGSTYLVEEIHPSSRPPWTSRSARV